MYKVKFLLYVLILFSSSIIKSFNMQAPAQSAAACTFAAATKSSAADIFSTAPDDSSVVSLGPQGIAATVPPGKAVLDIACPQLTRVNNNLYMTADTVYRFGVSPDAQFLEVSKQLQMLHRSYLLNHKFKGFFYRNGKSPNIDRAAISTVEELLKVHDVILLNDHDYKQYEKMYMEQKKQEADSKKQKDAEEEMALVQVKQIKIKKFIAQKDKKMSEPISIPFPKKPVKIK